MAQTKIESINSKFNPQQNHRIKAVYNKHDRFRTIRKIWRLRYRLYALVLILALLPLLYANKYRSPQTVEARNLSYIQKNILFNKTTKNTLQSFESLVTSATNKVSLDKGRLEKEQQELIANRLKTGAESDTESQKIKPISEIIAAPTNPARTSWLSYPKYEIEAPIIYTQFSDLFETNPDGTLKTDKDGNPVAIEERNADKNPLAIPVQRLLQNGVVHIFYSAKPGDVGNSYIIGHSSNYSSVKSDYNYIFKPLERKSQNGEDFYIFDQDGRKLHFKTFENLAIDEDDTATAYKIYENRRVVTLQCSILEWGYNKDGVYGYWPLKRWLTRGELVLD